MVIIFIFPEEVYRIVERFRLQLSRWVDYQLELALQLVEPTANQRQLFLMLIIQRLILDPKQWLIRVLVRLLKEPFKLLLMEPFKFMLQLVLILQLLIIQLELIIPLLLLVLIT